MIVETFNRHMIQTWSTKASTCGCWLLSKILDIVNDWCLEEKLNSESKSSWIHCGSAACERPDLSSVQYYNVNNLGKNMWSPWIWIGKDTWSLELYHELCNMCCGNIDKLHYLTAKARNKAESVESVTTIWTHNLGYGTYRLCKWSIALTCPSCYK